MSRIQKLENIYKETLKNKGIQDVLNFIQSIIDADITKGKYARFLLDAFLNDKFLEEDLIGGLESTVGQAISLFHKHKSKLPENMRSVFKYNSPGDLWEAVKQFQGELSGKELKRDEQDKIYRETEFIYKDEETGFQIISPLTEESAKWWGKGTRWCTSAEKNNRFEHYAKDAPLIILLMPPITGNTGNGKKLQLWLYKFLDDADNRVSLDYIEQNWNILEPICRWLKNLKIIPIEYRDYNLCLEAVKKDGMMLQYVPEKHKNYNLCLEAVKKNGNALRYVPEEHKNYNICLEIIKKSSYNLINIPKKYKTKELCKIAVKQNGYTLKYVPAHLKIKEICKIAVKQDGMALEYVPEYLRTEELCELAVENNGSALSFVSYECRDNDYLCWEAISKNGMMLEYVPYNLITKEMCKMAVKQDGMALYHVPEEYITKELCELAVQENGGALTHIPDELRTKELCKLAIQQNELKHYNRETTLKLPIEKYENTFKEIKSLFIKDTSHVTYS